MRPGGLLNVGDLTPRNRARNMRAMRAAAQAVRLDRAEVLCRVLGRYKMFVDARDRGLSPHLTMEGHWEIEVTEAIAQAVRPGMTVIDAGANLGYFSVLMADRCGPSGRVLAFEPNPAMARRLLANVEVNAFAERVAVLAVALGAHDGEARLHSSRDEPKNARIVEDGPSAVVPCRRLDAYPEAFEAQLIKIDVEGSEERLWTGMSGVLARGALRIVILEFAASRYGDPGGFVDRILGCGFRLSVITPRDGVQPITRDALLTRPKDRDVMLYLQR